MSTKFNRELNNYFISPVSKVLCLLPGPDELDDGEELLVAVELLLLLKHQPGNRDNLESECIDQLRSINSHEMMSEAALHHDPVDGAGQVDVRGQEDDVLPLQRGDALVVGHEVGHDLLEGPLPLAGGARAGTGVRPELAGLFVVGLLGVKEGEGAAVALVPAGEHHGRRHLLHRQVADVGAQLAAAGGAARQLGSAVGAHKVAGVALFKLKRLVGEVFL